jgi:hypothetical protein
VTRERERGQEGKRRGGEGREKSEGEEGGGKENINVCVATPATIQNNYKHLIATPHHHQPLATFTFIPLHSFHHYHSDGFGWREIPSLWPDNFQLVRKA